MSAKRNVTKTEQGVANTVCDESTTDMSGADGDPKGAAPGVFGRCFPSGDTREYSYGAQLVVDIREDANIRDKDRLCRFLEGRGTCQNMLDVLMKFYFGGVAKEHSLGQRALKKKRDLDIAKTNQYPRSMKQDYHIEFLKYCSSYTPLLKGTERTRTGGGYFLCLGGYGIVVDPGYQFLDKFYERNYSLSDIDAVIVTHYHADHYADLPALLALFRELYGKGNTSKYAPKRVAMYLDRMTRRMFAPMLDTVGGKKTHLEVNVLQGSDPTPQMMYGAANITLRTLPTSHAIPGDGDDSGVGLDLDICKKNGTRTRLIITGDTAWNDAIKIAYETRRSEFEGVANVVLVAHMSTVDEKEILERIKPSPEEYYYDNHLGLAGLYRAIETLKPNTVAISEIGEEIYDCMRELCVMLREACALDECIVASMASGNPLRL